MAVGILLHVPPPVASDNVVVPPTHTLVVPVIVAGNGFTVTTALVAQPVPLSVNVMVAVAGLVLPVTTPVTSPVVAPTVAIPVAPEVHVPPASVNPVVAPWHMARVPVIADGNGFIVIVFVAEQPETSV